MTNAAIIDGDTVIVREQSTALDGEIVVATVDGETTVKRLHLGTKGIRMIPENPKFPPIDIKEGDFKIHGVVIAVMRSLASRTTKARQMKGQRPKMFRQLEEVENG